MRTWKNPGFGRNAALILALSLATGACAGRAFAPGPPDALYSVRLNDRLIHVGSGSVLDLLNSGYAGNVTHWYASTLHGEPLVLLDRVQLDGLYRLADVPAFHAASIAVLRSLEARSRYGPRGTNGPIVVVTKRGRLH